MGMGAQRLLGIAICITGFLLVYFGYQDSKSDFAERIVEGYVDNSRWFLIPGMAAVVIGSLLTLLAKARTGRRRPDRI
jgi:hypothetical protein